MSQIVMICYIIMGADAKLRSRNVYKKTLARCAAAEGFRSSLASWADRGKVCPGACTHANTAADLLVCGALPTCMAAASHGDVPRGAGSCPCCSPTHVLVEPANPLVRSASYNVRPAGSNSANTGVRTPRAQDLLNGYHELQITGTSSCKNAHPIPKFHCPII